MENQDINTEFSSFIKTYSKENPSQRLKDIAERRNIDLNKLDASSLSNPDADYKAMQIWKKAQDDLRKLIDPMSNTLWELAFKYFSDIFFGGESDDEKKEAISDECGLPENRIDAEEELEDRVKEKICETSYTIGGNTYTLFSQEDAASKTPEQLCDELEARVNEMGSIIDQDADDRSVYNDVQTNLTFGELFKAMAAFLDKKVGAILKNGNMPIYKFSYDAEADCLVGRHIRTGLEVITVTPNINDEDDTGPIDDLICDINVAGLGITEFTNPLYQYNKDMVEVLDYITKHRRYAPGDDGEYNISGVKGSEVPALVYTAIQEWQATTTACRTISKAWNDAIERNGSENVEELKNQVRRNELHNSLAHSSGYSTNHPEYYQEEKEEREARANKVAPKLDADGNFKPEDMSEVIRKANVALGGPLEFTPEELDAIDGIDDGSESEEPDDRV